MTILLVVSYPSMSLAQTWKDWSQQNPTYQSNSPSPKTIEPAQDSTPVTGLEWEMQLFRASFLKNCEQGVPSTFCQCTLEGLEVEFTPQELLSQEPFLSDENSLESRLNPIYEECFAKTIAR